MRTFGATSGPFSKRPYYTLAEIERVCTEELDSVGLLPSSPGPIRIDRFVEKRFGVAPSYQALGDGILGYTRFGKNGVEAVVLAESLDSDELRVRTTLAHEAGHGLLHMHLFFDDEQQALFVDRAEKADPRVLCRDEVDAPRMGAYRGQWWEFQANRCIGGLLLPRRLVLSAVNEFTTPTGVLGTLGLPDTRRSAAVRQVADIFEVNPVVAEIRLSELFPKEAIAQERF